MECGVWLPAAAAVAGPPADARGEAGWTGNAVRPGHPCTAAGTALPRGIVPKRGGQAGRKGVERMERGGAVENVVFDVGNVLIRWDPRHLYEKLIPDAAEREAFLAGICTHDWNLEQDRGRGWDDAVAERVALFPGHEALIRAYHERWQEMVPGAIEGSVAILRRLAEAGVPLYAITNFSTEKFRETRARFPFLGLFRDALVSAELRLLKPDPAIYRLLLVRHGLDPARTLFIDDGEANIAGARAVGLRGHLFREPARLAEDLAAAGLPVPGAVSR